MCGSTDSVVVSESAKLGRDFEGPQTWAPPSRSSAFPQVIDLAAEADLAGSRRVAAFDALPPLLDTAIAYTEISLRRLQELAILSRAETALDYEQLGGVSVSLDLSHILQYLAGALDQVAGAQVLVARANVSAAAEELLDWTAGAVAPTDPDPEGSGSGGQDGDDMECDGLGFGGQAPERITTYWHKVSGPIRIGMGESCT